MTIEQLPCPKCQSENVIMFGAQGGRGTGDTTSYDGRCADCGYEYGNLPSNCDGRKSSAIREWNRHVREKTSGVTLPPRKARTLIKPKEPHDVGVTELPFYEAFAQDIRANMQYADALTKHVTGLSQIRRAACLQTLQAMAALTHEEVSNLCMWAKQQQY